jgi:class 3 adenylate cyclase/alpha-beta hydrolase superfamily lysophospholipase
MRLQTRYAKSGNLHIAYQVFGRGAIDLVFCPGFVSHIEHYWEDPRMAHFLERLGSFARVITFDKRGTGLSDREVNNPTLEDRMDDIRAVMDASDSKKAALYGFSEGASMAVLFAATYPQRCHSLILFGALDKFETWCPTEEQFQAVMGYIDSAWGNGGILDFVAPSLADDGTFREWVARYERLSASPSAAMAISRMGREIDIRHVLPAIHVPTLVMHRTGDKWVNVAGGRFIGAQIPGAQYIELPGPDHLPWVGNSDTGVDNVEEFLTGSISAGEPDRVLATVMFVDMVDSTRRASTIGDKAWRELLDRYQGALARQATRARGRVIKTTGDGLLATFDGPARAVRCGFAMRQDVAEMNLGIKIGLHTGEIELIGDDIGGIAVHVAARIAAQANSGEVLTSSTVKDLVAGSGLRFTDRGVQALKGLDDPYQLLAVEAA